MTEKDNGLPIFTAIEDDDLPRLCGLLAQGADVNVQNSDGNTPLILAAWLGNMESARLLLDNGAAVAMVNHGGDDALAWAAEYGHGEMVELLLAAGANTLSPALIWACEYGHSAIVQLLVHRGAKLEYEHGIHRMTPLTAAAYTGHADTVRFLLDAGANIHSRDDAALGWALGFRQLAVAELLLAHGANPNGHGEEGRTFLQEAMEEGREEETTLLKAHGAAS